MKPILIPANSALYRAGISMLLLGAISLADVGLLLASGKPGGAILVAALFIGALGSYGIVAGALDLAKWCRANTTPALLLTDAGITDATGIVTGGMVRWSEIRSVSQVRIRGHTSLAIELTDDAAYLARLPLWKRSLLSANVTIFGSPFLVSEEELAIPLNEVRALVEATWRASREAGCVSPDAGTVRHWWTAVPPEERAVVAVRRDR